MVVATLLATSQIGTLKTLIGRAQFIPANLIIDTQGVLPTFPKIWPYYGQGGEAGFENFTGLEAQLQELSPRYIRLDHVLNRYITITKNPGGTLTYDFSILDQLLSQIRAANALPFISLSYIPPAISTGDVVDVPSSLTEYQAVIQTVIEHISGTHQLNFSNVYYEVYNEPDLFGQWKTYGPKNYLTLYRAAARAAQNARHTNSFKLGGPAVTAWYDNWFTKMLELCQNESVRLDFYSWHRYSPDTLVFQQDIDRFNQLIKNYHRCVFTTEPIITEWGFDSENHEGYDTAYSAAHTVSTITTLTGSNLTKAFTFQIEDGPDTNGLTYWGRWGLLTHRATGPIQKPRFQALTLLNQLGDQRLSVVGQGSFVKALATKNGNVTQVIISNFDPEAKNTESVPLTFQRLQPGTYTLTRTFLGRPPQPQTLEVTDTFYTLTLPLPPTTVLLLELTPS
jgi:xylan 1,4-beta-xylosidase